MMSILRKSREQPPKHTRTSKSCTPCAKSKVKCVRDPATDSCKKCLSKGLECQWPEGNVSRSACDECKKAKSRCEPSRVPDGACRECERNNRPCSRAIPQPAARSSSSTARAQAVAGPSHPTPPAQRGQRGHPPPSNPAQPPTSGSSRPSLQIDPFSDRPTTPPSVASSPRSYWSVVLASEDDMDY
ncbi:hypothetical protein C8Q80DRAFT_702972 [Daedaleopsis nitida]|nr:hypothetical protein C8Q80DRAFT_702972 [Daedaleopsis nitida]